jgi:hypothetical protein
MEYHKRISQLESTKIDIEYEVAKKDNEVRGDAWYILQYEETLSTKDSRNRSIITR